ncbi:MAG TPA: FHIPEP family type III secretion protein [Kofleriaceae bacterium]|jgi:hypothetical protein
MILVQVRGVDDAAARELLVAIERVRVALGVPGGSVLARATPGREPAAWIDGRRLWGFASGAELAVLAAPELLATPETLGAIAAAAGRAPDDLAPYVRAALAQGLSLGDRTALRTVEAPATTERVEAFLDALGPRTLALSVHPADLRRLLGELPNPELRPLSLVHAWALDELGLPLPTIELRLDAAPDTYAVVVNGLAEPARPLPTATGDATALHMLAAGVFSHVLRRAPRLVGRAEVTRWCAALNRPALVALAAASPHADELPRVLRRLVSERVSIRHLDRILARLADHLDVEVPSSRTHFVVASAFPITGDMPPARVRIAESARLAARPPLDAPSLRAILVDAATERDLLAEPAPWSEARIDDLLAALPPEALGTDPPLLLASIELRALLAEALAPRAPELPVVAYQELARTVSIVVTGTLRIAPPSDDPAPLLATAAGEPVRVALPADAAPPAPGVRVRALALAADPLAPPDALDKQGWGLVLPAGERGDHLRALIAPLERYRCDEQHAAFRVFRIAPSQAPARWISDSFESIPKRDRPRYVLVLGDFDEVSLDLQLALSPLAAVGRLAFDTDDAYRAYAAKAVAAARAPRAPAPACVYLADDGSDAIALARAQLSIPLAQRLADDAATRTVSGDKAALLAAAAAARVLVTVSHGLGDALPYAERRARQGTLLTAPGEFLTAADVATAPFAPGGMWFLFACFGAGTPAASRYAPWLAELSGDARTAALLRTVVEAGQLGAGEPPFVAAVPKAALANPQGPLCVIGHVDLAWAYGFQADGEGRFDRYYSPVRVLARGGPAGVALEELAQTHNDVANRLVELYSRRTTVPARQLAQLWMLREDLHNFILLGDPACAVTRPTSD